MDRSGFLEKVRVEVYESEEGVACVGFHSLVASLTKVYLETVSDEIIQEGMVEPKTAKNSELQIMDNEDLSSKHLNINLDTNNRKTSTFFKIE